MYILPSVTRFSTVLVECTSCHLSLVSQLSLLNVHPAVCHWVLNFLLHRPQSVKVNNSLSKPFILNTGAPQGCVLSPFLFTLFTNDCVSVDQSVLVTKFSDDTMVEGCIENVDETAYRDEVQRMVGWCADNNLQLNVSKTKEIIVNFHRKKTPIHPLSLNGVEVEQVESFIFLGTTISSDLSWGKNTLCITKKAQQRLYFLRQFRRFCIAQVIMIHFYHAIIESILTFSIVVWFSCADQEEKQQLEATVRGASRIIGSELPSIQSITMLTVRVNPGALHGIQPTQPTISLSFFPLVNAIEASRLKQRGIRTAFTRRL